MGLPWFVLSCCQLMSGYVRSIPGNTWDWTQGNRLNFLNFILFKTISKPCPMTSQKWLLQTSKLCGWFTVAVPTSVNISRQLENRTPPDLNLRWFELTGGLMPVGCWSKTNSTTVGYTIEGVPIFGIVCLSLFLTDVAYCGCLLCSCLFIQGPSKHNKVGLVHDTPKNKAELIQSKWGIY